jgi:LuxR family transcriptional regulator, maltose regulon positive regulatory protein
MTEPLVATSSRRDLLLATKVHIPGSHPGQVPRPRLLARLDGGLATGVILVCAPAGYGKTVLLADWARGSGRPVAWLSLDAGDNDPARFWRHAVAALDGARPGIGRQMAPLLGPPAPSYRDLVAAVINEVAADDAVLVLDDYHVISSDQVRESLAFLVEHRPDGLCVALASRSDPPLALARLRARGQLTEIREADLRFTSAEAADLLQHAVSALPDASVAALTARTEGWAAGLQLAALSLRGQDDAAGFVAAFTGSHRYVLDYLAEEVLDRQDEELRTFLLETSVLDRLSGPLCDAITGREGSQVLLGEAERAGLFVIPLDEVRGWWRYHHLFADLLHARLQAERSGRLPQLHRNAAAWYAEHGLADDAIRHAVAAGEMLWAARLVEQHFDAVYYLHGEAATIHRWLSVLPAEVAGSRPRLLLAQAQMAAAAGRVEEVESAADAAERASADADEEPFEPTVGQAVSMLVNVTGQVALERSYLAQLRGDPEGAAEFAAEVLACSDNDEWLLRSTARGFQAVAEWLRGRLDQAERAIAYGIADWRSHGQATLAAWGSFQLCQVQRAEGCLDAAVLTCRRALEPVAGSDIAPQPASGPAHIGLSEVAYQRNQLDLALQHATDGIALCRRFVYTPPLSVGLATLALIRQASGEEAGAREAIEEAEQASPVPLSPLNIVPAQRARLLLAQGDLPGAARWAQDCGLGPHDEPDYAREAGHLLLARVLLAQGRPALALALLGRLYAAAKAQGRVDSLIQAGGLRALALAATGDQAGAIAALTDALALACPQGYVRVFADEGPPMAFLLGRLIAVRRISQAAAGIPLPYLARLQRAFTAGQPANDPSQSGIIDPLTIRELEVLDMLAAGRSNQAIARELVVTLDTVKKHVGHVLGKLGAANRTEAAAHARELGLIP